MMGPMPQAKQVFEQVQEQIATRRRQQKDATTQIFSGLDGIMGYGENGVRKLAFGDIECVTVLDRKVIAIDTEGCRFTVKERLRDLESALPSYFIRINKSTLANEHHIARFDAAFSGGVDAVFRCGYREYVSRRCFAEIRRRYEGI